MPTLHPLPRLKIGSLLPGYPLSTPLTFQAKIRAVTALLNGVTASYASQLPELCLGPPDPWGFARLLGFPGVRSPPGPPREQPLPYGAYNRTLTALYSAITAIFGLISGLRPRLIYIDRSGTPAAAPHKTGLL